MIEISECSKGSKRLLEFKRIVRLCHHLPVNVHVHWEVNTDEITIEFPNGHKVSSTLFEGLSDRVAISLALCIIYVRR